MRQVSAETRNYMAGILSAGIKRSLRVSLQTKVFANKSLVSFDPEYAIIISIAPYLCSIVPLAMKSITSYNWRVYSSI